MKLNLHSLKLTGLLAFVVSIGFVTSVSAQTTYVWNVNGGGTWDTGSNWTPAGPADGAGNTADFTSHDVSSFYDIGLQADRTIGHITVGDTDNGVTTPGVYDLFDADGDTNVDTRTITLDGDGTTPTITVGELGVVNPGTDNFDSFYLLDVSLAGTQGFRKQGDGILTLAGPENSITGDVFIDGGTLRLDSQTFGDTTGQFRWVGGAGQQVSSWNLADGTTLHLNIEDSVTNNAFNNINVAASATATLQTGTDNTFLSNVTGAGTGLGSNLNVGLDDDGNTYTLDGSWTGFDSVTFTGQDPSGVSNLRLRANGGGFNFGSFENTAVTLNNTNAFARPFSHGGRILIGELSGDATGSLSGGDGGATGATAPTYVVGGLNTNSEFAGVFNGNGGGGGAVGMFFEKIGTGTLTLSGSFNGTFVDPGQADDGEKGGVFRVSEGTVALTNTFDNIAGGSGTTNTVIDVASGATLDVSGTTNTFSTSALQEVRGTGTIVGTYNHDEGDLRPGDVAGPDGGPVFDDGPLVHTSVATVGTLNFNGALEFNGGNINFDMDNTPAGANDLIDVTGTASVAGGGTITPNFLNGTPAVGLTYTVVSTSGGITDSPSGWTVNWFGRGAAPTVSVDGTGNLLQFTTTAVGAVGNVTWVGDESTTWDVQSATETNWTLSGSPDVFFQGDNTTFDDTATSFTVDIAQSVSPSSVTVNNSANDYTINDNGGGIVGTGTFLKQGSGNLTMQVANGFSGDATIEQGNVDIGGQNGALGTGNLTLAAATGNSATVTVTGNGLTNSGLTLDNTNGFGTNTLQLEGGAGAGNQFGVPTASGTGNLVITSTVNDRWVGLGDTSGLGGFLTIGGDGVTSTSMTVRINGFTTDLSGVALTLQNGTVIGNQAGSGSPATVGIGALSGDATNSLTGFIGGGSIPFTEFEIGSLNTSTTFSGVISDGDVGTKLAAVTKVGSGELILDGANTYTGDTSVEGGTLSITTPFLADTSTINLTTGALLKLDFGSLATIDTIDSLFIDGIGQTNGTWGAIGSGADNESALFDALGLGLLSVTTDNGPAFVPEDLNMDGFVDGLDLGILLGNWNNPSATPLQGELNGTPPVDGLDLGILLGAWNPPPAAATAAVPEPTSVMLIMLGLAGSVVTIRRR